MKIAELKVNSYGERCYVILISPKRFQKVFTDWEPLAWGFDAEEKQAEYDRIQAEKDAERRRLENLEYERKLAEDRKKREEKRRQKIIRDYEALQQVIQS